MIKLQGKRNSAVIFADKIDKQTKTQISSLLREEAYSDSKIRMMPDVHSGSRQLGSDVAVYYQDQAYRYQCKKQRKRAKQSYYDEKGDGTYCKSKAGKGSVKIKREEATLEGELFECYLHDIGIVTAFADRNRRCIAELICDRMGLSVKDRFSCIHNYIDTEAMILRKGAISARLGERVIIPLNMRDGAILAFGKGNPEWNFSAPHGAGRVCTRTEAKYAFNVEEFQREMVGIYTTTAREGSIDECPMAYKPPERILEFIGETVSDIEIIKPIYNFKSC